MKITDVEKAKGTRYNIYVDGEYWFNVDYEIVLRYSLKIDLPVDEEELDTIKRGCERRKARERAYYLLGYRDHSKDELYKKLQESARPEIALEIVLMVEEQGLLNDEAYAHKLARYYLESKKWGARRAQMEMGHKGLDRELIAEAIEACDVDAVEQIVAIIDKKYAHRLDEYKERQKVASALARLGYSFSDINEAIRKFQDGADLYEE